MATHSGILAWEIPWTEECGRLQPKGLLRVRHDFSSVQFSCSVVSDSLRPMNHSTPGLPVHHQLPEFTQTHVHRVSDAIQPYQITTTRRCDSAEKCCQGSLPRRGTGVVGR